MWRVLLADDEAVIVKGLRRLIDWQALGVEVVGEATDGAMAAELLERLHPELVVSDIRMPGLTGLELMARFQTGGYRPKFIFVSGYEEFSYAREALSGGAVDYLLKPVPAPALEGAVRRALGLLETQNTADLLQSPQGQLETFFDQLTANRAFAGSALYQKFTELLAPRPEARFAGLCFGLPVGEEARLAALPYERRLLQKFMVFNAMRDHLERSGHGYFLRKDDSRCCIMGLFSPGVDEEAAVRAALDAVQARTGVRLRVGMGRLCADPEEIAVTYADAMDAFALYYFQEEELLRRTGETRQSAATNEDFNGAVKGVFHSIVSKSDTVLSDIDRVMDLICDLHYGNQGAAYNRTLVFTGDLCQLLFANRLLTGSFAQRQDALQHALEECRSFQALRRRVLDYYKDLLPAVYQTARGKNTAEICRVQQYIETHYGEDLSLKTLAELACVSPHYFSAYFKAETGQNYKAYLTNVRMERAMALVMATDQKTYEIAEQVGYNNVRRFVDAFRAAYQMSPMDYRKLHKKPHPKP